MAGKEIRYEQAARDKILAGVNGLANAVRVALGSSSSTTTASAGMSSTPPSGAERTVVVPLVELRGGAGPSRGVRDGVRHGGSSCRPGAAQEGRWLLVRAPDDIAAWARSWGLAATVPGWPVEGAFVIGALSGFGLMAACAAAELLADHVTDGKLPSYAAMFSLERYNDPAYRAMLDAWGATGQL